MNFEAFLQLRDSLRHERPELADCSELNLYRSLAKHFDPIAPSTHAEAPFRCHLAEPFLEQLGLPRAELKARTQVSHGIRRSLRALFSLLAANGSRVAVPSDVYPVYLQLAAEAGVKVTTYEAREGVPRQLDCEALLLCDPLKPWGGVLTDDDGRWLTGWVREDERRMVIIDSAYAVPPTPVTMQLVRDEVAVLLVSLSKGWLIPDHSGLCVVPTRWQPQARAVFAPLPKDETRLRIGYAALTEHRERLEQVTGLLRQRADQLDALGRSLGLGARPCVGYFATCEHSFKQLLERGVLGVPASLFGGPESLSILSSLEPAPRDQRSE